MKFPYLVNICYIINNKHEVLLQLKARGFGKGKLNGPGGKIRPGEELFDSVKREVKEETDLEVFNLQKKGEIEFIFTADEKMNNFMHVFVCHDYSGKPIDKGEGKLEWFNIDKLPFDKMWDDDKYWLGEVLAGKYVHKRFYFNDKGKVIRHEDL